MSKMTCSYCEEKVTEDNSREAINELCCDSCFDEYYCYCERCGTVLTRDAAYCDSRGYTYCDECHEDEEDPDCPDNPDVTDLDRDEVLRLSRCWLFGKKNSKRTISIKNGDANLNEIKEKVGLVDYPLYVYGLVDREEYQLKASSNIISKVKEFISSNDLQFKVERSKNDESKLGISLDLRLNHKDKIVELIKDVTFTRRGGQEGVLV